MFNSEWPHDETTKCGVIKCSLDNTLVLNWNICCGNLIYLYNLFKITGAGHGIGRELAIQYANLGAIVVCVDINEKGNEETVKMIKSNGISKVHAYKYVVFILAVLQLLVG